VLGGTAGVVVVFVTVFVEGLTILGVVVFLTTVVFFTTTTGGGTGLFTTK